MSVPNRQIGWSNEATLLWDILKQLDRLAQVISNSGGGGGSGTVTSVSGTPNRITISGTPTVAPVVDIASTYTGQSSIVTVGTLTGGATGAGFTINLSASTISGILPEANGGTGVSTGAWLRASGGTASGPNVFTMTGVNNATWNYATLGANTGFLVNSNATDAASNTQTLFKVTQTGANGTASQTTFTGWFSNTKTGTTPINVAVYVESSGATTNYAIKSGAGQVLLGNTAGDTITAGYKLDIRGSSTGAIIVRDAANTKTLLDIPDGGALIVSQANGIQVRTTGASVGGISLNGTAVSSNQLTVTTGFSISQPNGTYTGINFAFTTGSGAANNSSGTATGNFFRTNFSGTSTAAFNHISVDSTSVINAAATGQVNIINLSPTYTTAGGDVVGLNYNPTVTSVTGTHYAARFVSGSVLVGGTALTTNAILDLQSTTRAFIPPRMTTTQRDNIGSPSAGMVVYNTTTNKLNVYTTAWEAVTSA